MCRFCVQWPRKKRRKGIDLGGPRRFEFHFSTIFVHDGFVKPNSVEWVNNFDKPCCSFHSNEILPVIKMKRTRYADYNFVDRKYDLQKHTLASSCLEGAPFGSSTSGFTEFKMGVLTLVAGAWNQPRNSLSILDDSVRFISMGHMGKLVFSLLKWSSSSLLINYKKQEINEVAIPRFKKRTFFISPQEWTTSSTLKNCGWLNIQSSLRWW